MLEKKYTNRCGINISLDENYCPLCFMGYRGNRILLLLKYNIEVKMAGKVQGKKSVCYELDLYVWSPF